MNSDLLAAHKVIIVIDLEHVAIASNSSCGEILAPTEAMEFIREYKGKILLQNPIASMRTLFPKYAEKDIGDIGFILSLSVNGEMKPVVVDDVFGTGKALLETAFELWHTMDRIMPEIVDNGQYELYEKYFEPTINVQLRLFYFEPEIDAEKAEKNLTKVDDLVKWLYSKEPVMAFNKKMMGRTDRMYYKGFSPLDADSVKILMKDMGYPEYKDLHELLWKDEQHNIVNIILQCIEIESRSVFAGKTKEVEVPTWKPNMDELIDQAFSLGYFDGPLGQRFHTPLALKSLKTMPSVEAKKEAKEALSKAKKSKLLAMKCIVDTGLPVVKIYNDKIIFKVGG